MAKYLDSIYSEDIYGDRIRTEIPITISNLGYYTDVDGVEQADVRVAVGPVPWEYYTIDAVTGEPITSPAQIAIIRGNAYYPPDPDTLKVGGEYQDGTPLLMSDLLPPKADGTVDPWTHEQLGQTFMFNSRDLGIVAPGSVLYIRVFVREYNPAIKLPWDMRGQAWSVVPGNYGGVSSALDALPRGVMTEGMVYGEHWDNPNAAFMSDIGYMLDTIVTDGELMVDDPQFIHPNMVLPLLRAFGMGYEEEAFFTDHSVSHRLKHILAHYRSITMAKGTMNGLAEYVATVTGIPTRVYGVLNMLLDRSDTCPDNYLTWPSNMLEDTYSVMCTGARWLPMPTTLIPAGERDRIFALPASNRLHRWNDTWYDTWDGEPYLFGNHTGTAFTTNVPPPPFWPTQYGDPLVDPKLDSPAVGWVHQFDIKPYNAADPLYTGTATFGNKQDVPYFNSIAKEYTTHWFRFRYLGAGVTFAPSLAFLDIDGDVVWQSTASDLPTTTGGSAWGTYGAFNFVAPPGSKYIRWRINMTGSGVASVGAISVTNYAPAAYRDPRAIAVMLNTGASEINVTGGTLMEDTTVTMESALKTMEDSGSVTVVSPSLESFEKILIAKLYGILDLYVPSGVQVVMLTSDDPEFGVLWEQSYQYSHK